VCGIAGFTHPRHVPDPQKIWEITRSLTHRGPDQQGVWESAQVSLGAVRLKIIDLENGAQPMLSEDGDTVLVYNGEIYNSAELRGELEGLGHRFQSHCDTETLLHAFLQWDTAAFGKLRGMFAAGFWTQSRRRLVLVRDRMGIKPLYFARQNGNVYFGSEVKTILAHSEISRRIDRLSLDRYLSLNYVPGPGTMIEGIEKLPPGHFFDDGKISAYWTLEFRPDKSLDLESAKGELDRLLQSAVREHLVSDVPLGVWSSGGLDSSTILDYAARSASHLKTFSISFHGREFDESQYFQEVARKYQTDHHEFDLSSDMDIPGTVQELAQYSDDPSADAGAIPVWFLSRMCRGEVTVALSGDGADELFGGYNTYLADAYAQKLRLASMGMRRLAARMTRLLPVSDNKIGLDYKITRMLNGSLLDPVEAHFFWNGTFNKTEKRRLLLHPVEQPELALPGNNFLWLDQLTYLPDDILHKCDRMSMAHSLEVRPPFLDHRIVEFAAKLPANMKIRGSKLKFLLRELMKDRLPNSVLSRRKEGFDIPVHHWLRTVLRPLLLDTLNERTVRETGIFSWPAIEEAIEAHLERRANLGYHLWGLLILFLWIRYWKIEPKMTISEPIGACIAP
jgi:asparagine synthase (glutamine-hydrolysing)